MWVSNIYPDVWVGSLEHKLGCQSHQSNSLCWNLLIFSSKQLTRRCSVHNTKFNAPVLIDFQSDSGKQQHRDCGGTTRATRQLDCGHRAKLVRFLVPQTSRCGDRRDTGRICCERNNQHIKSFCCVCVSHLKFSERKS